MLCAKTNAKQRNSIQSRHYNTLNLSIFERIFHALVGDGTVALNSPHAPPRHSNKKSQPNQELRSVCGRGNSLSHHEPTSRCPLSPSSLVNPHSLSRKLQIHVGELRITMNTEGRTRNRSWDRSDGLLHQLDVRTRTEPGTVPIDPHSLRRRRLFMGLLLYEPQRGYREPFLGLLFQ